MDLNVSQLNDHVSPHPADHSLNWTVSTGRGRSRCFLHRITTQSAGLEYRGNNRRDFKSQVSRRNKSDHGQQTPEKNWTMKHATICHCLIISYHILQRGMYEDGDTNHCKNAWAMWGLKFAIALLVLQRESKIEICSKFGNVICSVVRSLTLTFRGRI
jgi:hypothetical protein